MWDVAKDADGKLSFAAHPTVQRAARNINIRQTIYVISWVAELAIILGFAAACQQIAVQDAGALEEIVPVTMAVIGAAIIIRQALALVDAHPLATKHCSPSLGALGLAAAFLLLILIQACVDTTEVWWMVVWAALSVASTFLIRAAVWHSPWGLQGGGVAVLGQKDAAQELTSALSGHGRRPVITCLPHDSPASLSILRAMVEDGHVEAVVLTTIPPQELAATLNRLADLPIGIYMVPNFGLTQAPLPEVIELLPNLLTGPRGLAKRAVDLAGASAALLLFGPLLILAGLLIRIETPGPVLFRQVRFGLGGRATEVWKFRTMHIDKQDIDGEARTLARDPRVTRVGRWLRRLSIDELPQIFNVLRGDLSLVGPRPHATKMKVEGEYYADAVAHYPIRHRVKPGITGWAQVNGSRGEVDTLEKARRRVELDLWYITNWSLILDIWIIFLTAAGGFATLKAD
jgi:exopolysaccharide biosynthesis polyprenyl glycosylphosphotransferase